MQKEIKYTSDGIYSVYAGSKEIARSFIGDNGYEVRIRQGMDRSETIKKICEDCPDYAAANEITLNYYPKLF